MYKKLAKLSDDKVVQLLDLTTKVPFTDKNRRLGMNGNNKLSVYTYSKWTTWNKDYRDTFKNSLSEKLIEKSLIGWFLIIPKKIGFLDIMNYWVDQPQAGTCVLYALVEQSIWINNERVHVAKGEGIQFSLKMLHEIKPENFDQKWACVMTFGESA